MHWLALTCNYLNWCAHNLHWCSNGLYWLALDLHRFEHYLHWPPQNLCRLALTCKSRLVVNLLGYERQCNNTTKAIAKRASLWWNSLKNNCIVYQEKTIEADCSNLVIIYSTPATNVSPHSRSMDNQWFPWSKMAFYVSVTEKQFSKREGKRYIPFKIGLGFSAFNWKSSFDHWSTKDDYLFPNCYSDFVMSREK